MLIERHHTLAKTAILFVMLQRDLFSWPLRQWIPPSTQPTKRC